MIKALIGPMNKYRTDLVQKVFDKLDITQQGLIDVNLLQFNLLLD